MAGHSLRSFVLSWLWCPAPSCCHGHFFSPLQTLLQCELTRLRLGCLGKLAILCRVFVFEVPYQVCCVKCSLFLSNSCNPKFTYLTVCYGNVVVINFIIPPDRRHTRAFRFKLLPCSTLRVLCRILHPARLCTPSIGRFRSRCVGEGLGLGVGLGLGNHVAISTRGCIIWQGCRFRHNTGI